MFGIGVPELILILIVGLVVFGPSKLPEIGRTVGKGIREFRKASGAFQNILNAPDDEPRRTMEATHGGEKTAAELSAEAKPQKKVNEEKNDIVEEKVAESTETDIVKTAEAAHGYTPPTKESVQAAIDAKKHEMKEDK